MWAGAAVMAVLFLYIAVLGPRLAVRGQTDAPEPVGAKAS